MQPAALIDGDPADAACLEERAFQFGDGVFETVAILDGQPCLWSSHIERLFGGCRRLGLPLPDAALLYDECRRIASGHARAVLKIFITAGCSERGYRRPAPAKPRRALRISQWQRVDDDRAWNARCCDYRLSDNPHLAGIKHLNRLDQVLARTEWTDDDIDEGIVRAQDGRIVSGTMSNLFVQKGSQVITPSIDSTGIAGVIRRLVLELGAPYAGQVVEGRVEMSQLREADAVFLTNSLIGIKRLMRIDDVEFDLGVAEHPVFATARGRCHQSSGPA